MQRLLGLSFLLITFAIPAIAQDVPASPPQATPPPATQEAPPPVPVIPSKTEISGGFTLNRYNETTGTTTTMPGGYGDVEHNIIQRWLGAELQGVGGFRDQGVLGNLS